MPLPEVHPGDLITAEEWNALIEKVNALEQQLADLLQGSNPQGIVRIDRIEPSGDTEIGSDVHIYGANFAQLTGAARVFLLYTSGGVLRQRQLLIHGPNANNEHLVVQIPHDAPAGPASFRVTNSFTFATWQLTLVEEEIPIIGDVSAQWLDVTPSRLQSGTGTEHLFRYQITGANREAEYTLHPVVSISAWQPGIEILDSTHTPREDEKFTIPANAIGQAPTIFYVKMVLSPERTIGTHFTLGIEVTAAGRHWSVAERTFTVGDDPTPQDSTIDLREPEFDPPTVFNDATNTISLAPRGTAVLAFETGFTVPGTYRLVRELSGPPTGWSVAPEPETQTGPFEVTLEDISRAGGRVTVDSVFVITAPASVASGALPQVTLGYRNVANSQRTTHSFLLRLNT